MPTKAEIAAITTAATADERTRFEQILRSPEGMQHPKTAIHFALLGMTPDQAISTMATLPKESPFLDAMDREGAIGIKPGASGGAGFVAGGDRKEARLAEIKAGMQAYNAAKGYRRPGSEPR